MKLWFLISGSLLCVSCMTRAPSNYELDKRAGLLPNKSLKLSYKSVAEELSEIKGQNKASEEPLRVEPRIEKVWIYNQELNDSTYLQGTYLFFQIDNGYWVNPSASEQK